jgi:hypothetical protein
MSELDIDTTAMHDTERELFTNALAIYFGGGISKEDALNSVEGISHATYYRRLKTHPDEMRAIEKAARARALALIDEQDSVFLAEQTALSREIRNRAAEGLARSLDMLVSIASGETREIQVTDRTGQLVTKRVAPYPRDIVSAAKELGVLAREGVIVELATDKRPDANEDDSPRKDSGPPSLLGNLADFSEVTAKTPSGRVFKASLEQEDVIDAE